MRSSAGGDNVIDAFKAKVLAVDDEKKLLEAYSLLLSNEGYEVLVAPDGAAAIALLKQHAFDVMLLDWSMPGLGGYQVMEFVKDNTIDTAIVVISGNNTVDGVAQALRLGAYDYIRKPFAPEEVTTTVANVIKHRRLEKENKAFQNRINESDKLHRYIVNSSPDIVYMLDQKGNFTFLNDRVEKLLGYSKQELMGKHYTQIIESEDLHLAKYVFNERRTDDRSARNVELRLRCKEGVGKPRSLNSKSMYIELTAMGVYSRPDQYGNQRFIGTYGTARDITERKEAEEVINFQAYHDLLTRLPNRALFKDRLGLAISHAKRNQQKLAVIFLDLDRFKVINDTLGHAMGDRLLQIASQRLQRCLREEDTLSRFGGDEFTLLLTDISSSADVVVVVEKIHKELQQPFVFGGNEVFVGASIGISLYPDAGATLETLIKNADTAMYHVKGQGKNGYQFYSEEMEADVHSRLTMERDLRKALENSQFEVYFQPQVNANSGEVVGMEALVRWNHPEKGVIFPDEFIPLAEETGLIIDIGNWVLDAACAELSVWHAKGYPNIKLGVNFSPFQVDHAGFVPTVLGVLKKHKLPGDSLEVEITESAIMKDMEIVIKKLRELSYYGIKIAIDDFGTGYSSLSYLQKFPINTLKIDRCFVNEIKQGESNRCIVNAIVYMGKGLGLNLIAEGVETKSQLDYLKELGCSEIQGFIFGKAQQPHLLLSQLQRSPYAKMMVQ